MQFCKHPIIHDLWQIAATPVGCQSPDFLLWATTVYPAPKKPANKLLGKVRNTVFQRGIIISPSMIENKKCETTNQMVDGRCGMVIHHHQSEYIKPCSLKKNINCAPHVGDCIIKSHFPMTIYDNYMTIYDYMQHMRRPQPEARAARQRIRV